MADRKTARAIAAADRLLGGALYGLFGLVMAVASMGGFGLAAYALSGGAVAGAMIVTIVALGFAALARWCFSRRRRLSDTEWPY